MNFIIKLFLNSLAVILTAYLLPGVHLTGPWAAVLLAALLAVLNTLLKPVLVFLTIPATILSLGLFLLVINALIIEVAAWILTSDFKVDSFWWALGFSIVLSIINGVFDRLTVKTTQRENNVKVFDKDGNQIA